MRMSRMGAATCAVLAAAVLSSARCSLLELPSQSVTVLSYNLQTLFDDEDDGAEFSGWSVAKGEWGSEGYRTRLRNFVDAIASAFPRGPDVIVLQEVENIRVADDLADLLPGEYPTRVVAGNPGQALHSAVLAKLPLVEARAHSVFTESEAGSDSLRPLLEVVLDAEGVRLTVLAAHWKSKLGGAEATEPLRRTQAALAVRRISEILSQDPDAEVLLAGDLNENPDEWTRVSGSYPTALLAAQAADRAPEYGDRVLVANAPGDAGITRRGLALWSPWEEYGGWSYIFDGVEERIDNLLLSPGLLDDRGLSFKNFTAKPSRGLLTESGIPREWDTRSLAGYSDHLPIRLELALSGGS